MDASQAPTHSASSDSAASRSTSPDSALSHSASSCAPSDSVLSESAASPSDFTVSPSESPRSVLVPSSPVSSGSVSSGSALVELDRRVAECRACPRLVTWREEVARTKRAAFADWTYWGRPVPGFGPSDAPLLIVGLAPAAHGGNRTGRMFTGDRSGDVLYQALYDVGLASQPTAVSADDGLELYGVRVTSPVHCAPPANKPTPGERDTCRPWLVQELRLLRPTLRAVVVLGAFGWQAALPAFGPRSARRAGPCHGPGPPSRTGRGCRWTGRTAATASKSSVASTSASATPSPAVSPPRCCGRYCARRREPRGWCERRSSAWSRRRRAGGGAGAESESVDEAGAESGRWTTRGRVGSVDEAGPTQ